MLRSAPDDSEAEEVTTKNVVMQDTSNTASIGDMNSSLGFGYIWQEPEEAGTCGATYLTISAEIGSHSVLEGLPELWPLRVTVQTPERADDDETFVLRLRHCQTPSCTCKMTELLASLAEGDVPHDIKVAKGAAGRNSSGSSSSASAAPAASQAAGKESDYEPDFAEDQEDGGL